MFDVPTRLVIAYGLIALLVLAAAGYAWWRRHNTQERRDERRRTHLAEHYRKRDEGASTDR